MTSQSEWGKGPFRRVEQLDRKAAIWVQRLHSRPLTVFFRALSLMGEGQSWLLIFSSLALLNGLGWLPFQAPAKFLYGAFAALIAWAISTVLKRKIKRERPFQTLSKVDSLYKSPKNDSFPSSHTAASFAFFFALLLTRHPLAWLVGIWATLVAFSRIYLGVHYLSDIYAGIVVAMIGAQIYFQLPI